MKGTKAVRRKYASAAETLETGVTDQQACLQQPERGRETERAGGRQGEMEKIEEKQKECLVGKKQDALVIFLSTSKVTYMVSVGLNWELTVKSSNHVLISNETIFVRKTHFRPYGSSRYITDCE